MIVNDRARRLSLKPQAQLIVARSFGMQAASTV
jgi:hypothetical protein